MSVTPEMIKLWRENYGLDTDSPADAMNYWSTRCDGMAPAGAVAALGLCMDEIATLRAQLAAAELRAERLESALTPGKWTNQQAHVWHCTMPDVDMAFEALRIATLAEGGPRWADGGDAMAGAMAGM